MTYALKPYPAYKPAGVTWLQQVPEHWGFERAKSVFRAIDVKSKTGREELLTVSSANGIVKRRESNVNMFKAKTYVGHKLCWPEDLVVNSLWAWGRGLGFSREHGIISTAYGVYRLREQQKHLWQYLDYTLRSSTYQWELQIRSKGVWKSRLQLTDASFFDMPILMPPKEDAELIVRYLHALDAKVKRYIRTKRKLIAALQEQKQAIIQRAVTRGLDPKVKLKSSGVEWLGEVPEHWEVLALKRMLVRLIDCEHKTAPETESSSYVVVRTSAVKRGVLELSGTYRTTEKAYQAWTRRGVPEPGDVIFTREAPAGEACVVPTGLQLCLGQRTVLMKLRRDRYDPQFLVHMIYSGPPALRVLLASQGSTVGHFNMSDIGDMLVFAPPLDEQHHILSAISAQTRVLDIASVDATRSIDHVQEYHTRLLADVVTGAVDVRAAAKAMATELAEVLEEEPLSMAAEGEAEYGSDESES